MACNQRLFLFTICTLQLISTIERQVFDLLGYQWLPIAANFLHIIFIIIGFFGGYQYRKSYLITFAVWLFVWLAWNLFIICFYLDVGALDKNSDVLNLGTGAASWWEVNGIGCRPYFTVNGSLATPLHINVQLADVLRPPRPDWVDGCLLNYYYVEVIHAAVQLILAPIAFLSAVLILRRYTAEEEMYVQRKPRSRATSLYSVQYSSTRGRSSPLEDEMELNAQQLNTISNSNDPNRPMTPRRVKRRSGRGSGRHSRGSQRNRANTNPAGYNTGTSVSVGMVNEAYSSGTLSGREMQNGTLTSTTRSSGRESLRKKRYVNPVNRLMDESSTSNDSMPALPAYFPSSHPNGGYPPPPPVNRERLPSRSGPPPTSRPPAQLPPHPAGHSNPLYQSSRPNSVYSVSANVDLDYRPPSAHSSYSNWHGQRSAMPLPANGHTSNNLHGHSPTPSTATTTNVSTFGVSSTTYDVGTMSNGYTRSAVHQNNYGSRSGYDQGHY